VEEIQLERGGLRLSLRREQAVTPLPVAAEPGETAAAPVEAAAAAEAPPGLITSEYVGIFHRAREAGDSPLAEVGERVESGKAIGVIDTLGMLGDVEAPLTGRLSELLVQDGQPVEYGQPIAIVEPE
jgi:biotin carboxyl carrier protein